MKPITIVYEPSAMSGEPGFQYRILRNGRELASGWSRGARHHAERMAKGDLRELERKAA